MLSKLLILIEKAGAWVWKNRLWVIPAGEFVVKKTYQSIKKLLKNGKRNLGKDGGGQTGTET